MIITRFLTISMLLAPLAFAQGIEEPTWRRLSFTGFAPPAVSMSAPSVSTPDLTRYREFQLGMDLLDVVKRVGMLPAEARLIHQRPAVIQELEWRPLRFRGSSSETQADSVKQILFSFYNRELFKMVVQYDSYETDGLTAEDMIEAIAAKYGTPTKPVAEITFSYDEKHKVLARWEDSQHSFDLVRSEYSPSFAMVASSKPRQVLALAAIADAGRLDTKEAPQKELDRQKKVEDERRVQQEKARLANKARFRP